MPGKKKNIWSGEGYANRQVRGIKTRMTVSVPLGCPAGMSPDRSTSANEVRFEPPSNSCIQWGGKAGGTTTFAEVHGHGLRPISHQPS